MSADLKPGTPVRVFFGRGEHRDGVIEHAGVTVDGEPCMHVRMSPGWVHLESPERLMQIPRRVETSVRLAA
jgi:hypothetical protein